MEVQATGTTAQGRDDSAEAAAVSGSGSTRRDLALLGLLLLAALALRAWHLMHTEVAARDSIGFIRYAWQLGHHPWIATIRDPRQQQHPGYPFAILAVSTVVRALVPGPEATVMQLSAQLTSCLASVLLIVPSFYLGRELFNRGVGFWAALLFQCLPSGGRVFADGLSEGVFLLFAATALFGAVRAVNTRAPAWFALAGIFGALAYLTRPEGALIVGATGLVLLALQCVRARRVSWRRFLACGAALGVTAVAVGCPLFLITGKLTVKPTPAGVWGNAVGSDPAEPPAPPVVETCAALPFAVWVEDADQKPLKAVAREFAKGGHYVLWLPTLLGLFWFRERWRRLPGAWVPFLVSLAILALMWRVASLFGYVSDRHLLLPLFCASFLGVAAVPRLVSLVAALLRWLPLVGRLGARLPAASQPVWGALLLGALAVAALPKTLEPLHPNRTGFRGAGEWIAEHGHEWDEVVDPYSWAHYYSGSVFHEDRSPAPPPGGRKVAYVVIEESGNLHPRLHTIEAARKLSESGQKVWEWSGQRSKEVVDVVVYEVPVPY
jgi:hypothetical protein